MRNNKMEPQKMVSITMKNNMNLVEPTCSYVENMVKKLGMSEQKTRLVLGHVKTILERRMENAYYEEGDIVLDILVGLDRIILEVSDQGIPYWIDIQEEVSDSAYRADRYKLKLGTEGQCFSMCFYLESGTNVETFDQLTGVEEELLDANLHIRRVEAEEKDIVEVLRCIHSNYGYGYVNRWVYDFEHMKAILQEERQWSYLGYNDHGQTMAHMSVTSHDDFPGMVELGGLVCKPFCRGHNVAKRLTEEVCKDIEIAGVKGIFGFAVAFHSISQKLALGQGMIPTGMLVHYVVPESAGEYRDGDRRLDCMVCAKLFDKKVRKISAPKEHQAFIKSRYQQMGADCEFMEVKEVSGRTDFRVEMIKETGIGKIIVENANYDFEKKLKGMMKDFARNKIAMLEVFVNMNNPSAAMTYEMLKRQGFFFSGIMPGSELGEYMLMQSVMGNVVEWDKIVTADGFTEIVEYVKAHKE